MKNQRARMQQKVIKTVSALAQQTKVPAIKKACAEIKHDYERNADKEGREKLQQLIPLLRLQEKEREKTMVRIYTLLASLYVMTGNHKDAIKNYNLAINIDNKNPELFGARAFSKAQTQDYHGALADYDKSLGFHIKSYHYYIQRGYIKALLNDPAAAAGDFNRARIMDPGKSVAYAGLGEVYARMGMTGVALKHFNTALEIHPRDKNSLRQRAGLLTAETNALPPVIAREPSPRDLHAY